MKKISFIIVFLLVMSLFSGAHALAPDVSSNKSIDVNFGNSLTQSFSNTTSIQPDLPDIGTYVENNLTDFSSDGTVEYSGNDVVSEISQTFYDVNVTLTNVDVVNDKDGLGQGAGEIFVEGYANGNYTRFPEVGNELILNDGENIDVSAELLLNLAFSYNITFEVREADTLDTDDSLGFISFVPTIMANESLVLTTDTGDATLTFNVTAFESEPITAKQILDNSRPYLHIDDETGDTELPNDLVGRVIVGNDNGKNAMVLQYYFYWDNEYSPDGGVYSFNLHKNDFEAFYVYYDLDNFGSPYRMVFNNYIYTDLPGFPTQDLLILEEGAVEAESNFTTVINSDLQLLLGASSLQEAQILPMSAVDNWEYDTTLNRRTDAKITSLLGSTTVQMTVDTSYHTFDLGPGGNEYGFDYNTTSSLNDSRIKSWYGIIEDTFNNGTRNWSYVGVDIPEVGPFTFDVTQVFEAPYVISGYSTVSEDTAAIERAKNSYLNITQSLSITVGYNFPSSLDVEYDSTLAAGGSSVATITYTPSSNLEITVGFDYEVSANLSFWLAQASYDQVFNGEMIFDIDTAQVSSIADLLGLNSFELEDQSFGSYLSLTGLTFNPKLFGTILEGSMVLDLWQVLDDLITPTFPLASALLKAIGFFVDYFTLSLDFALSGVVTVPISTSNSDVSLNTTSLVFDEDNLIHFVELSASSSFSDSFDLVIGDIAYGLNFALDWVLGLGFKTPISDFVANLEWNIGTFPDYTSEIISSPGDTVAIDPLSPGTESDPTSNIDDDSSTTPDDGLIPSQEADTNIATFMVFVSLLSIIVFKRRYR